MAIKEISSQSAIDHKEKTHNTHVYSEFVLSFICIYLNMAIGSSKLILAISFTMLLVIQMKATFYCIMYVCQDDCRVIYWRCISGIWFVNASNDTQSASIT